MWACVLGGHFDNEKFSYASEALTGQNFGIKKELRVGNVFQKTENNITIAVEFVFSATLHSTHRVH